MPKLRIKRDYRGGYGGRSSREGIIARYCERSSVQFKDFLLIKARVLRERNRGASFEYRASFPLPCSERWTRAVGSARVAAEFIKRSLWNKDFQRSLDLISLGFCLRLENNVSSMIFRIFLIL